ncbi:hypothetical protein NBH00_04490 [Paraconexibacter antarcticus]|uniref:Ferric oxidoreductase domain-containing protein n=1 Tax=Paraconexibacter antarcticus TaxID=2949664 RepID=A0ABY5DWJ0_9ACTN|nr:hypothetical protein [Paraconexibacter antarcticus]UTI65476.1 hypothetical protein NBH00_04490 [Paraconexibacter antarcticus]
MTAAAAAVATSPHLFWITSRAAGTVALVLASVSVGAGILMGTRLVRGTRAGDLRALHEVLSLATLVALAVHGLSLLGDSFLHPAPADVLIPFVSPYHRWWSALGLWASWALVALGLGYYARGLIGHARWRTAHRFTALAWAMGVAHSLGMGTDAGTTWFLALTALAVVPPALLLLLRLGGLQRATAPAGPSARGGAGPAAVDPQPQPPAPAAARAPARLF